MAGGVELMPAPWDRPGESAATRRLRIFIFFAAIAAAVIGVAMVIFVILFSFRAVLFPQSAGELLVIDVARSLPALAAAFVA